MAGNTSISNMTVNMLIMYFESGIRDYLVGICICMHALKLISTRRYTIRVMGTRACLRAVPNFHMQIQLTMIYTKHIR
jgi:hypothetical protein